MFRQDVPSLCRVVGIREGGREWPSSLSSKERRRAMGTTKESGRGVKCRAGDTWTESRYFQFIRSALRAAWNKYPVKGQVLRAARRSTTVSKTKKHRFEYRCAVCDKNYIGSQVQVDHINPCGSLK